MLFFIMKVFVSGKARLRPPFSGAPAAPGVLLWLSPPVVAV